MNILPFLAFLLLAVPAFSVSFTLIINNTVQMLLCISAMIA